MPACLICNKELKAVNNVHLKSHDINANQYCIDYPFAELYSKESKEKIAKTQKKRLECKEAKLKISKNTKIGMHKKDAWDKFISYIKLRDTSGKNNSFYGKRHSDETKKSISQNEERSRKISDKKNKWWENRQNLTVEELFGEEKGKEIRRIKSEQTSGEKNPAYGKIYLKSGRGKSGFYKNQLFRSTWEYSFYKHLELEGLDVENKNHLLYEPFSIKYHLHGRQRTYTVDFYLPEKMLLIEIKCSRELIREDKKEMLFAKFEAIKLHAKKNNLEFKILTENDFKVLSYKEMLKDQNIVWIRK